MAWYWCQNKVSQLEVAIYRNVPTNITSLACNGTYYLDHYLYDMGEVSVCHVMLHNSALDGSSSVFALLTDLTTNVGSATKPASSI